LTVVNRKREREEPTLFFSFTSFCLALEMALRSVHEANTSNGDILSAVLWSGAHASDRDARALGRWSGCAGSGDSGGLGDSAGGNDSGGDSYGGSHFGFFTVPEAVSNSHVAVAHAAGDVLGAVGSGGAASGNGLADAVRLGLSVGGQAQGNDGEKSYGN